MNPRPDHGETSYRGSGRLVGRKACVTGGDSGIGRAVAIAFAREGADVAINYLPVEERDAREVVEFIRAEGRKAVAIPGDIRNEDFCYKLISDTVHELGGLDILVNNAATQAMRYSITDLTTEQFDSTFKTNVYAMFWITKAAMPHLSPGATIINTSSVQAYDPSPMLLDYAQTKACIVAFTKSLAKQVAKAGIRVNAVAPGPFWTPLQTIGGPCPIICRRLAMTRRLDALVSLRNWVPFTSCSLPRNRAMRPGRSSGCPVGTGTRRAFRPAQWPSAGQSLSKESMTTNNPSNPPPLT